MDAATYRRAKRHWARRDPILHRMAQEVEAPVRALASGSAFESLVEAFAHQQVSLASGQAIVRRLHAGLGSPMSPAAAAKLGIEGLRGLGLSRPKAGYVADLAERVLSGALDLEALAREADDDEVVARLVQVKGIGVWTAKMHLIFHLGRPDVVPHEDLGIVIAVEHGYGVPRAEAAAKIQDLAPLWSPYGSTAALTLWAWRRQEMAREKALKHQ